ncbi:MAG: hypothetical protein MUE84_05310 [Hyphomonas sp.]|nr:hypothetical protein [Hyphomonas sp.]
MSNHLIALTGHSPNLQAWVDWILKDHSPAGLSAILADDVVVRMTG